jgi:RNA polymerase sigma factor (sigma-70 family)
MTRTDPPTRKAVETVFRFERARLIAGLARLTRDVGRAEDLAQDALLAALTHWPRTGVPANPRAWLMAVARRRALDGFRHAAMAEDKQADLAREAAAPGPDPAEALDSALDDDIGDEMLGLIFTACHPVLTPEARAALTLRLIGGLSTAEIARAFLTSEAAIAQRIVRAKAALRGSGHPYAIPRGAARHTRLGSVLEVIYLIFNEGYSATAGADPVRPALCAEALRLARVLAGLMAEEPEVHGLLALMELQASRLRARTGPDGAPLTLAEQDRSRWDRLGIGRGLAALDRAVSLGGTDGPYALQAAIAACHGRARRWDETDWPRISGLYDRLAVVRPDPVVALNRAVAHSMAFGPEAGLALIAAIESSPALNQYAPLPAAKGDFLLRAGRKAEARSCFERAAALAGNGAEQDFLLGRAAECGQGA